MKSKSVITGCILITVILGTLNNLYKKNSLPGIRFYFGNGVLFLMLSILGEFEDEIAKTLALAIATFVAIGEGGGVLNHFLGADNTKNALNTDPTKPVNQTEPVQRPVTVTVPTNRPALPTTVGAPLLSPVKPVIPTLSATNNGL